MVELLLLGLLLLELILLEMFDARRWSVTLKADTGTA